MRLFCFRHQDLFARRRLPFASRQVVDRKSSCSKNTEEKEEERNEAGKFEVFAQVDIRVTREINGEDRSQKNGQLSKGCQSRGNAQGQHGAADEMRQDD